MIILNAIILVLGFIIALASALGLSVKTVYRLKILTIFPPVSFLRRAMLAFDNLRPPVGQMEVANLASHGMIKEGEEGFKDIVDILKENGVYTEKKVTTIKFISIDLSKTVIDSFPGISPISRTIEIEFEDGDVIHLAYDPFDPAKPITKLRDWIENSYQRKLLPWLIGLIVAWLLVNSYFLWLGK